MSTLNQDQETRVRNFFNSLNLDIDIFDFMTEEEILEAEDYSGILDVLEDQMAFSEEVIGYSRAMEFLMENDWSLQSSMRLASDMGFEVSNLTSETLASLLWEDMNRDAFHEMSDEIERFMEDLLEEIE